MINIKDLFDEFRRNGYLKNKLLIGITLLILTIGPTAVACMSADSESTEVPISDNQAKIRQNNATNKGGEMNILCG